MKLRELYEEFDVSDFEESLNDYMDPQEQQWWEDYSIQNRNMHRFAASIVKNEDYQEALQQNLKRIGIPNVATVYRGHVKGTDAVWGKQKFANVTLSKSTAKNFRKAKFFADPSKPGEYQGIAKDEWTVSKIKVNREDIIAHGNTQENEFIILTKRARINETIRSQKDR